MTLKKKGVPKDFTINKGIVHNKKVYIPISEIVKALTFYRNLKGDAIAKLFKKYKVNQAKKKK